MAAPLRRHETSTRSTKRKNPARASRPKLALATPHRRRWPAVLGGMAMLVVMAGLLGAAVFHTQLAERQLRIGDLEQSVIDERDRFDELRYRRAELRSPVRLAREAGELGMARGDNGEFVEIDAWSLAEQIAAAGVIDEGVREIIINSDPLQQFSDVKRVSAGQP